MSRRDLDQHVLSGLELPPHRSTTGRWPDALREQWLEIVEVLLGRGVDSPARMSRLTRITPATCAKLIDEVKTRWAKGVSARELNWRREGLYREADEVARHAWDSAEECRIAGDHKEQGQMLKIVLASNARKAKLIGADTMAVQIRAEVTAIAGVDIVAQVEADYGLAAGALEKLGRHASVMFSEAAKKRLDEVEDDALDVDFEVAPELPAPQAANGEPLSALGRLLAQAGQ